MKTAIEREFTMSLRIPAWAGPRTRVLVNGKAVMAEVRPGTFHAVKRGWRNDDVIEVEFNMPLRLETLSMSLSQPSTTEPGTFLTSQTTSQLGALMSGPVVFMATGPWPIEMSGKSLLAAEKKSGGDAYSVATEKSLIAFKPFMGIGDELYRTYQPWTGIRGGTGLVSIETCLNFLRR